MTWPVPFDIEAAAEAMAWFLERRAMTGDEFDVAEETTRRRAFWLRRVTEASIVEDIYRSLSDAIQGGMSPRDWEREVGPRLLAQWAEAGAAKPEVIMRNWVANSYSQERRKALLDPAVVADRPYWLFDGVADSRQSEICAHCDGVVARADDPWWHTHTPPLHHQCRSGVISLSRDDLRSLGKVKRPPAGVSPQPGWGNPDQPWEPTSDAEPVI